ncbi:MAG: ribosome silencing factor [Gammaproteobacteria bacterium]|nr:ribosome silencing factor [Gammaproteobacteria bacterium]
MTATPAPKSRRRSATTAASRPRAAAPRQKKSPAPSLTDIAVAALGDMKAVNVKVIDVRKLTDVTDTMIIATGTSDRHVRSIADRLIERCRGAGHRPSGVEGEREGEWVLVDLRDLIVHVMLPRIREYYGLEKLWEVRPGRAGPVPA